MEEMELGASTGRPQAGREQTGPGSGGPPRPERAVPSSPVANQAAPAAAPGIAGRGAGAPADDPPPPRYMPEGDMGGD